MFSAHRHAESKEWPIPNVSPLTGTRSRKWPVSNVFEVPSCDGTSYAFNDTKNPVIFWCIPISSQIDKYSRIYKHKLAKQINGGARTPKCDTICFGEVMGAKKAFLIQNMFPVIEKT
jgi:hypothetical protein